MGAGSVGYFGGKSVINIPSERLKGGRSILNNRDQEIDNNVPECSAEKMKEDVKSEIDNEHLKRKAAGDVVMLLQWGHRKRPRCSRVDLKHISDESSVLSKKTIRVDLQVVKAEKELAVVQTNVELKGRPTKPYASASETVRRNGNGSPATNSCSPPELRNSNNHSPDGRLSPPSPHKHEHSRPQPSENASPDPFALLTTAQTGAQAVEKVDLDLFEWPKIFLSLSRKEKEDDFFTMKGTKLPQRPKRRPKVVEKALHYCSPGSWLSDLARGRYDVREKKSVKKKPRGLKAMESMDSDSE